jgi:hypothetical protein
MERRRPAVRIRGASSGLGLAGARRVPREAVARAV